jgi:hypothetical protein
MSANNLPPSYRFDFGDYTSLGDTFQKFLSNLNVYTLAVYNILNKGIGFQNLQRVVYTVKVTAGTTTPVVFVNPLPITPSGVVVCNVQLVGKTTVAITSAVSAANWTFDGRSITVLDVTGLTSGSVYMLSMEIF